MGLFTISMASAERNHSEFARSIHKKAILVDGHNDLPWQLREKNDLKIEKHDLNSYQKDFHTDIPRLKEGGVGAQFWSAYVPVEMIDEGIAVKATYEQIALIHRMVEKYPNTFEFARTAEDIRKIRAKGKIASLIGVEGGHSIDNSLDTLRDFYAKGARYMTLTHNRNLDWCDAATDKPKLKGLSPFGEEVVREMNRLGIFIDISHISADAMRHALKVTKAPVIASHSSAYALKNHVRNVPDDVLKRVALNGGVVMVNFYSNFIMRDDLRRAEHWVPTPRITLDKHSVEEHGAEFNLFEKERAYPRATVSTVVDHIEHIIRVAGVDYVGLGSDFDGVPLLPDGLKDVSKFPAITEELLRRGYSETDILKILGGNLLRAMSEMEKVARAL